MKRGEENSRLSSRLDRTRGVLIEISLLVYMAEEETPVRAILEKRSDVLRSLVESPARNPTW